MATNRQYDHEFKVQAIKLAQEIGQAKAAKELGISKNTMYTWTRAQLLGYLDLGCGTQTPQSALSLHEELVQLRARLKVQDKEIRRLKKENDFLEEASAFFAASRLKSTKIHRPNHKPNGSTKADRQAQMSELLYGRYDTKKMTTQELKVLVWRYFMSYWNNRRICSANGGLPPMVKRRQFYDSIAATT